MSKIDRDLYREHVDKPPTLKSVMAQGQLPKLSCRMGLSDTILWVTLDAPTGNVIDSEMVRSLRRVVNAAANEPALRLVVFEGKGRHFSYGASVEEHQLPKVWGMLGDFHDLFRDFMQMDIPTLALIRGKCLGGGLELAAFCDRIVIEEGAELGLPEIKLGVFAPMGSLLLSMRCRAQANSLLLTGETVDAETALAIGLADEVVGEGEGTGAVTRWAENHLVPLSAASLRRARKAARWILHRTVRLGLDELERLYFDDLMQTHDAVEGIDAFLAKRKAEWTNG
jgi:cyclohexa-1,5-dienecarbonyl-CoA hydratase